MDEALQTLLNGSGGDGGTQLFDPAKLLAPLLPFVVIITIVTILIGVLYVVGLVASFRAHRATIETRNILREMNERDKARTKH